MFSKVWQIYAVRASAEQDHQPPQHAKSVWSLSSKYASKPLEKLYCLATTNADLKSTGWGRDKGEGGRRDATAKKARAAVQSMIRVQDRYDVDHLEAPQENEDQDLWSPSSG